MRIVVLCGAQPNQVALCNLLHREFDVAAVVLSQNIPRRSPGAIERAQRAMNQLAGRTAGRCFRDAWVALQASYTALYSGLPPVSVEHVSNVNDDKTVQVIASARPDVVVVSGTNLVGSRVIAAARAVVNLHTGISPYVKGGPNCTNWCLSQGWFHLIGNTVMCLDAGIDTGAIITTERTPLTGREDLEELHWKVMSHAHDLYLRSLRRIAAGQPVPNVPQRALGEGRTFYNRQWNAFAMWRARVNFDRRYRSALQDEIGLSAALRGIRLVGLETAGVA